MAYRELEPKGDLSKVPLRLELDLADRETFCNARYPFGLVRSCK
jgi:hypothetical protein